jgi:hypothetical protein
VQGDVKEVYPKGKIWIVKLSYLKSGMEKLVEYKIDSENGAVREWFEA